MLLIGGPAHGQERDLDEGQKELSIMAQAPDGSFIPVRYILRGIQAETRPGQFFQRDVLVESSLSVEVATEALAAIMLQKFANELVRQFMEGGVPISVEEPSDSYPSGLLKA